MKSFSAYIASAPTPKQPAYWFYSPASYLMADFTFRKYTYPSQLNGAPPNPDSSAYDQAPRGTLELQHWLDPRWRVTATYQLYAPTFAHDSSTRIVNHKLTGELLWAAPGGFRLGALAGGLRDPDPKKTRPVGSDGNCDPVASPTTCAATTSVKYRVEPLVGGFVGYGAERWSLEVKGLTNRDLDQSYSFSVVTTATAQPWDRAELTLAWVHDAYSSVSAYSGKTGEIVWGSGRYWVVPSLALGGGGSGS